MSPIQPMRVTSPKNVIKK